MYGPQESRLSAQIHFNIIEGPDRAVFQLIMPEYAEQRDKGRKPTSGGGNGAVRENLKRWVERKGFYAKTEMYQRSNAAASVKKERTINSLAYLISRKIHREGYKGNHFYSDVINDGRVEQLTKDLADMIKKDVIIEII